MKFRKFSVEDRDTIIDALKYLAKEMPNAKPRELARELNKAKVKYADGSKWTGQRVSAFMRYNNIAREIKHVTPSAVTEANIGDKISVAELVLASRIGDAEKTKILSVIFGGTK